MWPAVLLAIWFQCDDGSRDATSSVVPALLPIIIILLPIRRNTPLPLLRRQNPRKPPKLAKVNHQLPQRARRDGHALGFQRSSLVARP